MCTRDGLACDLIETLYVTVADMRDLHVAYLRERDAWWQAGIDGREQLPADRVDLLVTRRRVWRAARARRWAAQWAVVESCSTWRLGRDQLLLDDVDEGGILR